MPDYLDLIEREDLNALLRVVDSLCAARDWDELIELANRCDDALERGRQLWPIAAHVDYRLALEAPGEYAAEVLERETHRFSLGPLTEVAASTHTWDELGAHIGVPQVAAYAAQERVLRGERLVDDPRAPADVLEMPLELTAWEPTYTLAAYKSDHVEVPEPWDPRAGLEEVAAAPGEDISDPELTNALLDLVLPWTNESNGAASSTIVEGDARAAASRLTFGPLRMGRLEPAEALQRMAWAAAGGGAYGRRRGAALGRLLAWSVVALACDVPWPPDPSALGAELARLRWWRWDEGRAEKGWVLRIAVEDPEDGWSAALAASDLVEDDDAQE